MKDIKTIYEQLEGTYRKDCGSLVPDVELPEQKPKNNFRANDSRVKSLVCAYTVIGWKSHKIDRIIFSIKGIAFFLKVWYNTDKGNGLVFGPGSTCGGDVPRHFLLEGV